MKEGPITTLRRRLPKVLTAANDEGSNQRSTDPTIRIGPIRSGRTVFGMPLSVLLLVTMLTGFPLWAWAIVAICHPRVSACPVNGRSYVALMTTRWRASKSDKPYSPAMSYPFCTAKPDEFRELVSRDSDNVYDESNTSPRERRLVADSQSP